jgi:maltooligosyltrehalose trehalohydrolase
MMNLGADYLGNGRCRFTVWAPRKEKMLLHTVKPVDRRIEMQADEWGYFSVELEKVNPGDEYFFIPDDKKDLPDPASHHQSQGVHGPSMVVDHAAYQWKDTGWTGIPFQELVLYELHVGTFSPQGTFEAVIPFLDDLLNVGINGIELMPVAQFPGNRNWGYDGVYPYAVQDSYGGPDALKKLVDACHQKGIAIFLDVVYNHLGPEGNYFPEYGPYFTEKYRVPWGDAINFDGRWSDGVREYFMNNALFWFEKYHIDGLRLDAIHAIYDHSAFHLWEQFHCRIRELEQNTGRLYYTIAESDLNNPIVIKHPEAGGYGFTGQWLDDFHHALYVLLHPEGKNLYVDFGAIEQLAKAYTDGFVHSGEYVSFRKAKYGKSSAGIPGNKFIVFTDNHDQAGNRVTGARLSSLLDHERLKIAAAGMLLSPYVPMLFMGEEYAEDAPFYYFVSHSDKDLIAAVREGRKKEFEAFKWETEPEDPQDEKTFNASKLTWSKRNEGEHALMLSWYTELIALRRNHAAMRNFNKNDVRAVPFGDKGLMVHRKSVAGNEHLFFAFNFSDHQLSISPPSTICCWKKILDSKDNNWISGNEGETASPGALKMGEMLELPPLSAVVYSGIQKA